MSQMYTCLPGNVWACRWSAETTASPPSRWQHEPRRNKTGSWFAQWGRCIHHPRLVWLTWTCVEKESRTAEARSCRIHVPSNKNVLCVIMENKCSTQWCSWRHAQALRLRWDQSSSSPPFLPCLLRLHPYQVKFKADHKKERKRKHQRLRIKTVGTKLEATAPWWSNLFTCTTEQEQFSSAGSWF